MFILNDSISGWRNRLARDESYAAADLDELESHLREQVDALHDSGLSVEEAFWVAARRLGNAESLSVEFAKVNGGRVWANRLLWVMGGILVSMLASSLAEAAWWGALFAGSHFGVSGTVLGTAGTVARTLAWVLSAGIVCAIGFLVVGRSPRVSRSQKVFLPVFSGVILIVILGSTAARILFPTVVLRGIDVSAYEEVAWIRLYAGFAWSLALPLFLVIMIFLLGRKQARTFHA